MDRRLRGVSRCRVQKCNLPMKMTSLERNIAQHRLPNGLLVLTEHMPHVRSVSIGIWLDAGSRREPVAKNGMAHFIEHMVFKGTTNRTAEQIAREMDSVGGMLDAFTSKESACFNAKVLDEHLTLAFDVLSDMMLRPLFTADDIAKERKVVLEEIRMEEDNPESVVHEMTTQNFWRGHPLGSPILGTRSTVENFSRRSLLECFRPWYAPNRILVTAAGAVQPEQLNELVGRAFGALPAIKPTNGRADRCGCRRSRMRGWRRATTLRWSRRTLLLQSRRIRWRTRSDTQYRCSTTFSAAACRRGCFRISASARDWRTRSSAR